MLPGARRFSEPSARSVTSRKRAAATSRYTWKRILALYLHDVVRIHPIASRFGYPVGFDLQNLHYLYYLSLIRNEKCSTGMAEAAFVFEWLVDLVLAMSEHVVGSCGKKGGMCSGFGCIVTKPPRRPSF